MKRILYILIVLIVMILLLVFISRTIMNVPGPITNSPDIGNTTGPTRDTLMSKEWEWEKTTYNDGVSIVPKSPGNFMITFREDNTFSARTDCNAIGGEYRAVGNSLRFSDMISTLMHCEGSQERDFGSMLEKVERYTSLQEGGLLFELRDGNAVFR